MSYLTDSEHVRLVGGLPTNTDNLADAKIRTQLMAASLHLKRWVGTGNYAASLLEIDTARSGLAEGENLEENGNLSVQATSLRLAEAYLTMYHLVPSLNMNSSGSGITYSIVTEKGEMRSLSPAQQKELQDRFSKDASNVAWSYTTVPMPGVAISRAVDDAGDEIT